VDEPSAAKSHVRTAAVVSLHLVPSADRAAGIECFDARELAFP
jgi:hypothetical protein